MFELADDRPVFDRQPGETDEEWQAFIRYRDAGVNRSFDMFGAFGNKYRIRAKKVANECRWQERTAEWDRERDRVYREEAMSEVKKIKRRHMRMANDVTTLAEEQLNRCLEEFKTASSRKVSVRQLIKLIQTGIELERSCLSPEERPADQIIENRNTTSISIEGKQSLRDLMTNPDTLSVLDELLESINK